MKEWHPENGLPGEMTSVFTGTDKGLTGAPHRFRHGGHSHLTTAEGDTGHDLTGQGWTAEVTRFRYAPKAD